jgi:hypothetical protein
VPYKLVVDAVQKYPDRFCGLAGVDPTEGMDGVRELSKLVTEYGFIGAHTYPHWFELAPDHARYYPFYTKCVRTRRADPVAGRAVDGLFESALPAAQRRPPDPAWTAWLAISPN